MPDTPDFDEITLAKLAREMVMNVKNVHALFEEYGLNEEIYYELMAKNEYFKRLKEQYTLDWNSALSTAERLKVGSLAYLEQLIPSLTRRALEEEGTKEPLAAATGVANLLTKTAGIGDPKTSISPTERFVITINLGESSETYNKSIEVNPNDRDPNSKTIELRTITHDSALTPEATAKFLQAFEPEDDNGKTDNKVTQGTPVVELRASRQG